MRRFSILLAVVAFGFCSASFAQLMDGDTLMKGIGYVQEIKGTAQDLKASNEDCTFSSSEIASVYELALEYNYEVALKGGNINQNMDEKNADYQDLAKKLETEKKKKDGTDILKKKDDLALTKTTGYIKNIPGPSNFATFYNEDALVRKTATTLLYSWGTSLTADERKLLMKATNNTCSFKKVKVFGGVLDKVLKESGIPGMDMVNEILGNSGNWNEAGQNLLQNPNIMDKLIK